MATQRKMMAPVDLQAMLEQSMAARAAAAMPTLENAVRRGGAGVTAVAPTPRVQPGTTAVRMSAEPVAPTAPTGPSLARRFAEFVAPNTTNNNLSEQGANVDRLLAAGDTPRALGAATTAAGGVIAKAAGDLAYNIAPGARFLPDVARGIPAFVGGMMGSDGSTNVNTPAGGINSEAGLLAAQATDLMRKNTPQSLTAASALDQSMAQGRASADPTVDSLMQNWMKDQASGPMTMDMAELLLGARTAPPKAQTNKDKATGDAMAAVESQLQKSLDAATKVEDPDKQREAQDKATERYLNWVAILSGEDPTKVPLGLSEPEG